MIPNALRELNHDYVFQTNVISEQAIPVGDLRRVFLVQPMELQHALNTQLSADKDSRSDVFICRHIVIHETEATYQLQRLQTMGLQTGRHQGWLCQPIQMHGVKAMSGDEVFESICQNQRIFNNYNPESILNMLRADVEDWFLVCASTKPEDRQGSRNALRFQSVSALDLMATVFSKVAFCPISARYERNAFRVDFSRKRDRDAGVERDASARVYEQLVGLFG